MNFQEKLLDSFIAFEQDVDLLNPIHKDRKDALKRFEELGFPSKKDESWKYTSLKSLVQKDYNLYAKSETNVELKDVKKYLLNDIDSFKIVFIDGVYSPFLSKTLMMVRTYVFFQLHCQKISTRKGLRNILIK